MLGYGRYAATFERDAIADFVETAPERTGYLPRGDSELFAALDDLLASV